MPAASRSEKMRQPTVFAAQREKAAVTFRQQLLAVMSLGPHSGYPISSIWEIYSSERRASIISLCFLYFFSSSLLMVNDTE